MIVYPILNFVLPLMFTSFVFADNPQAVCAFCEIKLESGIEKTTQAHQEQTEQEDINSESTEVKLVEEAPKQKLP